MTHTIGALDVAYLHFGSQSGVTAQTTRALTARGHRIVPLQVPGPLEFRDSSGRRRFSWQVALHLAASLSRYGSKAFAHRWNTPYAFDVHSQRVGQLLAGLLSKPQLVLQNGALFAPGAPPANDYTLLLDHTRALSMELHGRSEFGLPAPRDYGPDWRARETAVYRGARSIATFSQQVARSLQRDYGISAEKIHVVGAGANVRPESVVRRDNGETILFVGKDFRRKGGPVLVRAFQRLRALRPNLKLIIAGPNERLDLPEGATNRGFVPLEQLPALFEEATMFVLPTLREPFGIAFLDAMACGLPCVGTAIEAVPEVIDDGRTGLLVPPGNDAALADAMHKLLEDPARAQLMGLHGRRKVDAGFTWTHVAEKLEGALQAALQSPRERASGAA
jgi:starch synthase